MDWTLAIDKNREALKRIVAMLVAMVASANGGSAGGQLTLLPQADAPSQNPPLAERNKLPPALPRHLHRFVLRLLRPAEAATRRLIIIAARGLAVEVSPPRLHAAKPKPVLNRRNGFGTGIVIRPGPLPEWAQALAPKRSSNPSLPLFDPFKRPGLRRKSVKPSAMPRIRSFDDPCVGLFQPTRAPDPLSPSPDDPLDAGRLHRRLEAMTSALDDLPGQAKRMARWQARRDAAMALAGSGDGYIQHPTPLLRIDPPHRGEDKRAAGVQRKPRFRRLSPMRPGHPPGWRRKSDHAVYEVLNDLHGLAVWVRERRDSS